MRTRSILVWMFLLGFSGLTTAHEGGHVTIEKEEAVQKSEQVVRLLVSRGKVEASWADAVLYAAELKVVGPRQWHVVFRNEQASEPDKKVLYVFLTADGQLLGANFTGEAR